MNGRFRPRERRLFNRLLRQRREHLPWWRFYLSLPLVTAVFGADILIIGLKMDWASPLLLLLVGMYSGIVLHAAASYRIGRRTWPLLGDVFDWPKIERRAGYGAELRK